MIMYGNQKFFKESGDKKIEENIEKLLKDKLAPQIKKQLGENCSENEFNDFFDFLINKMQEKGEIQSMVQEYKTKHLQSTFSKLNI